MSDKAKTYRINEVFYSVQGEGIRAGTPNVFVRFTGCNQECDIEPGPRSPGGFKCDTEFTSGVTMTLAELDKAIDAAVDAHVGQTTKWNEPWMICTGGEPGLQLDAAFCAHYHAKGWRIAVETNGSVCLPMKSAAQLAEYYGRDKDDIETDLATIRTGKILTGRHWEGHIWDIDDVLDLFLVDWITVSPKVAEHAIEQLFAHELKYVRGHGQGLPRSVVKAKYKLLSPAFNGLTADRLAVETCVALVKANPEWRLSVQLHKGWLVR